MPQCVTFLIKNPTYKKKVSTFVITTIFFILTQMLNLIRIYFSPLYIVSYDLKLKFPKLLKRDSAGDRLSKNRKTSC